VKPGTYDLLWVVNFPMFDKVEGTENQYTAEHHPFTRPRDEDLPYLDSDPEKVLAYAYDIVINGYEAGGGTLRIYDHDTQWKIFRLLGLSR
jgi:aspartyl-tRNA synthetase